MLKYFFTFVLAQLIGIHLYAQYHATSNGGRITVISDNQPFMLSLNGVLYNKRPEMQVTIDGLSDQLYTISAGINGRSQREIERRQIAVLNENGDFVEMIFKVESQQNTRTRRQSINLFAQIPMDMSALNNVGGVSYAFGAPGRPIQLDNNPAPGYPPVGPGFPPTSTITPISRAELDRFFSLMNQEAFDDAKLKIINPIFAETSLRVEQISEIIKRFQWDEAKFKVAKAAYQNCSDKRNYSTLTGNFTFLGYRNDLLKFIDQQQKMR